MNVIDISHWQNGISLPNLFKMNPIDGVIIKATGGVGYRDPNFASWAQWLIDNNTPWGFYHFLNDDFRNSSGTREADFFVSQTKDYFTHGLPVADYEYPATAKGTAYLKEFLDRVYELTGLRSAVYCSLSIVQSQDFKGIAAAGYPLWLAQYPNNNVVYGFIDEPWQSGSYAPFEKYWLHQYTSHGRLVGYGGNLDFDKFFGTVEDWNALVGKNTPELKPADPVIVSAVLMDEYGTGNERVKNLTKAGYDPTSVQNKINELYGIAVSCQRFVAGNEEYLNSIVKIVRSL